MYIAVALSSEDNTLNNSGITLNGEVYQKVFIYVCLQFKSGYKDNYMALTSLKIPLNNYQSRVLFVCAGRIQLCVF